jgi:hypothetical protein
VWAPVALAGPQFAAPFVAYPTAQIPVAVAIGDLDGDAIPDLISANVRTGTVSALLGEGDGTFRRRFDSPTSVGPRGIAIGDIDGDGHPDAAAGCYVRDVVSILHGHGDGTFDDPLNLPSAPDPSDVGLEDVDGDGDLDLTTLDSGSTTPPGYVSVRLNDGHGIFGDRVDFPTQGFPVAYRFTDMDDDGHVDLVVANASPNNLTILHGSGDGFFGTPVSTELPGIPGGLFVGDLSGDGHPDVAVYHERMEVGSSVRRIGIYLGSATGTLTASTALFAVGYTIDLAAGDFNGDGLLDLVALGPTACIYNGIGGGLFGPLHPYEIGALPIRIAVRDLNADGWLDLVVAAIDSEMLCVLMNQGNGAFGVDPIYTAMAPQSVAIGDLDGDSDADFAVVSQFQDAIAVHTGSGDGRFTLRRDFATGREPASVQIGDFNGDGRPDLASVSFDGRNSALSVLLADDHGSWLPHHDFLLAGPATSMVLGDWNRDGKLDVAACEWTANWPALSSVEVRFGSGDGNFPPGVVCAVDPLPMGIATADLDVDGDLDIVTTYRRGADTVLGGVSVLRGDGQGHFADKVNHETGNEPRGVAIGDLDADGWPDLVVANSNFSVPLPGKVTILRGIGGGNFDFPIAYAAAVETWGVALADFDADSHLDVALTNATSNTVTVWRGRGDGFLAERTDLGTGARPIVVACGDFDADHKPDLMTANSAAGTVTLLANRSVVVPVWVEDLVATPSAPGMRLDWRVAAPALAMLRGIRVQRALDAAGPYTTLGDAALLPAARMAYVDPEAPADAATWYRLELHATDGTTSFAGPVAAATARGLDVVGLDPLRRSADGSLMVRYRTGATPAPVRLVVVDAAGRRVRTLAAGHESAGAHALAWDARDEHGRRLARGVYWLHLTAAGRSATAKVVLAGP